MAVEKVEAALYRCDGCGAVRYQMPGALQAGYAGTITRTDTSGNQVTANWWAHTLRCVGNAAKFAIREVAAATAIIEAALNPPSVITAHLPEAKKEKDEPSPAVSTRRRRATAKS